MQTEQLGRIVNELDTIQFSIKKATQMVREIGKQVCLYVHQHALNSLCSWKYLFDTSYIFLGSLWRKKAT